jgi:lipid-A-disaccharide synthase
MRAAGVETVIDAASLGVVGLVEVVRHIPAIYREYSKLAAWAAREKPDVAILTDSPDFHLRLAKRLHRQGVPVVYLIAPQAWAWRQGRVKSMRRDLTSLLCIFPFEEPFFRKYRVPAHYIGHPLTRVVRPAMSKAEFFKKHRLPENRRMVVLLPGSRPGEIARHLRILPDAVTRLNRDQATTFVLATPAGLISRLGEAFFREPFGGSPIKHIEGETWDAIAHADLALAASGTVTIEAALLGTPMVTFYKVNALSWWLGRRFVKVPYFSMVNLVAGKRIIPELIQNELTGETLASEAGRLLGDPAAVSLMKKELAGLAELLATSGDPMERAAELVLASIPK